ncbi:MAG: hypothetical protein ACLSWI_06150 [Candidatus Gastranaerophilaceae bacterium]
MKILLMPVKFGQNVNYTNTNALQNQAVNQQNFKNTNSMPVQYNPIFMGLSKAKVAENALRKLESHIGNDTKLTLVDEKWLKSLRKLFGRESMIVNNPNNPSEVMNVDCRLLLERINKGSGISDLANALKTMIAAAKYKPQKVKLGKVTYTVHNREIANLMQERYSIQDFGEMIKYLNKKRVFDVTDNHNFGLIIDKERGIAKICGASENWEMSDRAWITDIMRIGDIQKKKRPETWTKALNTIGDYYNSQSSNFQKLIESPGIYREGNPLQGIPHIFMPKTLEPDLNWFNNKRLESHGLALKEFCLGITDGLTGRKKYGYQSADSVPQNVIESIDNLSKYFKAIDYPTAPSAGNWEEIPLQGGLTSDTESIRSAFAAYKDLMYNPKYVNNQEILKIRTRLNSLNPLDEKSLNKLIKDGELRVRSSYLEEAPGIRPHDSSLVFITTSDIKLADNVYDDVAKHVEILQSLENNLVRENGMIRYSPFKFNLKDGTIGSSPDSYLNLNYFNAIDKEGKLNLEWKHILDQFASKDCSEPEMFFARAKLSTPNKEAQWFMVSEMSAGYGKQIEKLLNYAKHEKRELNSKEIDLITKLKLKQTEFLNRALARISDENPESVNQFKANGLIMPKVTVSESHQYVTDIYGRHKMMHGTNAPLAWALSSLYKAIVTEGAIINKLSKSGI